MKLNEYLNNFNVSQDDIVKITRTWLKGEDSEYLKGSTLFNDYIETLNNDLYEPEESSFKIDLKNKTITMPTDFFANTFYTLHF